MNNKDKLFLASLQETMKEFVKADIGKAARADLMALEKAAGGAKRLAEADKVLAKAQANAAKIVETAETAAATRLIATDAEQETIRVRLVDREKELFKHTLDLKQMEIMVNSRVKELDAATRALKAREKAADERDMTLDRREASLTTRDAKISAREAKAKRTTEWEAQRPV